MADLRLWGDGDEVWAIEAAFETINLEVPVDDASEWWTVGDVWNSAVKCRAELAGDNEAWDAFRMAISSETGVDWSLVGPETKLIDGRGHNIMARLFTSLKEKLVGHG